MKVIGTCLRVKLCLIIKLTKSKVSSKSTKNQFIEKYVFYALAYYSTPSNDTIMIHTSFDCVSSPEENEVSMNKIEWEMKAGDSIKVGWCCSNAVITSIRYSILSAFVFITNNLTNESSISHSKELNSNRHLCFC